MNYLFNYANRHPVLPGKKDFSRTLPFLLAFFVPLLIFTACMDDDFDGDLSDVCPQIEDHSPDDQEKALVNSIIIANFNKQMKDESINHSTFVVSGPNGRINGNLSYSDKTVSFVPDSFLPELSEISVEISTEVYDLYDFTIKEPFIWTFTTGTIDEITAPYVVSILPDRDAENVAITTHVSATFNEPLDPATVTQNSLSLFYKADGQQVPAHVTYADNVITLVPDDVLAYETAYEAVLSAGIADMAGNVMEQDYMWAFETQEAEDDDEEDIQIPLTIEGLTGYAILSGTYIRNTEGKSSITGDVGLYPGVRKDITGIDEDDVDGDIIAESDLPIPGLPQNLIRDKRMLAAAYHDALMADDPEPVFLSGDQGGKTLAPGIYSANNLRILNGDLILDAGGDPDAFWLFQVESLIETGGNIILAGGAHPENIFWQAGIREVLGPNVLIGAGTEFFGTILSKQGISVGFDASVTGRLMVLDGGVRMKNATIAIP